MKPAAIAHLHSTAPKSITILGSTGSIGCNTLRLIKHSSSKFSVRALTAYENTALLAEQAKQFKPALIAIGNAEKYAELKALLADTSIRITAGEEGLKEAASLSSDIVMSAVVGAAGLVPTLTALRRGAAVAIANKECLVAAGELLVAEAKKSGATILPVDSEHNAIFQLFNFRHPEAVEKITITGSGGPFRTLSSEEMQRVTPAEAVKHPIWSMGAKISVDSATLMNKGLELIEACRLFPVTPEQVEIIIHPESVIHGMVTYVDGTTLAQLASPNMITPIACALAWPERIHAPADRLDLAKLGALTFERPDTGRFPALRLARAALQAGAAMPAVMNAANEIAVAAFLEGRLCFTDIMRVVESTMEKAPAAPVESLEAILATDEKARSIANTEVENLA